MRIIFATSEATPYIKSGGLADVLGSLPKEMVKKGVESIVILPKYQDMKSFDTLEYVTNFDIWVGWRKVYCGIFKAVLDGVTFYFVDNERYFKRTGLYSYDDDNERFAFFDFAVLEIISHLNIKPDILHLHDWQTAMIAVLYKERYRYYDYYQDIKIVLTIHNIAYQGKSDPKLLSDLFGLNNSIYYNGNCRHDECFNMMKSGIIYSDIITTVSPTYAKEILTEQYGEGLESVLELRKDDLYGILNGIDYDIINPNTDKFLIHNFNIETLEQNKVENKLALQKECGLKEDKDIALIAVVTRLTWQKGIDLILNQIEEMVKRKLQIIILGAGDSFYEEALSLIAKKYPENIALCLKYDFGLSCRIYGSCDMFLMPSLFEPCGLSQMMALRYGTVPIVRETGGLKDSVEAYNQYEQKGNGFSFNNYNAHEMMNIIDYALQIYYEDKEAWQEIVKRGMETKLDWEVSANIYLEIFKMLID